MVNQIVEYQCGICGTIYDGENAKKDAESCQAIGLKDPEIKRGSTYLIATPVRQNKKDLNPHLFIYLSKKERKNHSKSGNFTDHFPDSDFYTVEFSEHWFQRFKSESGELAAEIKKYIVNPIYQYNTIARRGNFLNQLTEIPPDEFDMMKPFVQYELDRLSKDCRETSVLTKCKGIKITRGLQEDIYIGANVRDNLEKRLQDVVHSRKYDLGKEIIDQIAKLKSV